MILPATDENIRLAASLLQRGELVAFPTETVYGLGANAFSPEAVQKIFDAKERPASNPLIVHVANLEDVEKVAACDDSQREKLKLLAEKFWPGPLSVILPKQPKIPDVVTAGRSTVGVRIPAHPAALQLIRLAGVPIAAPSANRSDYVSPTRAEHVSHCLADSVACVLDDGPSVVGIESTVLSLVDQIPQVYRPGAVTPDQLQEVLGEVQLNSSLLPPKSAGGAISPGNATRHYSPRTPICLYTEIPLDQYPEKVGLLCLGDPPADLCRSRFTSSILLGSHNRLEEAAARLYEVLREEDKKELDLIVVSPCSEEGIGAAIMDRVRRAVNYQPGASL